VRVVLDTNVLLSGLAYPGSAPGRIVAAWRSGAIEVVLSAFILGELGRVLPHLQRRLQLTESERADLVDSLALSAEIVEPDAAASRAAGKRGLLRDASDAPVLALLIASDADCLVTGDADLLALRESFPIVTPSEFEARHSP
jgi:uncharacterized protein